MATLLKFLEEVWFFFMNMLKCLWFEKSKPAKGGSVKKYLLLKVSGEDKPGITAALMNILIHHHMRVVDIGQAVTHRLLSLSILMEKGENNDSCIKDLLFEARKINLNIEFEEIFNGNEVLFKWERFVLSCVFLEQIQDSFIYDISHYFSLNGINMERIESGFFSQNTTLEIMARPLKEISFENIKKDLLKISQNYKVDMAIMSENIFRMNRRLIVFDMDSTLIQTEVIDELAFCAGVKDQVEEMTRQAMEGVFDFKESLIKRVSLLKGLNESYLKEIAENLPLTQGVEEFIRKVKQYGYKTAIVSGGFLYFARHLKYKLGMDYVFANDLEILHGELTGKVKGTIIDAEQKAFLLEFLAQQEGIVPEQVVAIGDGANDLLMLSRAGMGIAFHAKDIVRKKASYSIGFGPMTHVLHFMGLK